MGLLHILSSLTIWELHKSCKDRHLVLRQDQNCGHHRESVLALYQPLSFDGYEIATHSTALRAGFLAMTISTKPNPTGDFGEFTLAFCASEATSRTLPVVKRGWPFLCTNLGTIPSYWE